MALAEVESKAAIVFDIDPLNNIGLKLKVWSKANQASVSVNRHHARIFTARHEYLDITALCACGSTRRLHVGDQRVTRQSLILGGQSAALDPLLKERRFRLGSGSHKKTKQRYPLESG